MKLEKLKELLLNQKASYIDFPFGEEYMVMKIENKVFAIVSLEDEPLRINLKCDPNDALAYRDIYTNVLPGYHMNKKHWNTVILDNTMSNEVLKDMIKQSYDLVFEKLTKKEKEKILNS